MITASAGTLFFLRTVETIADTSGISAAFTAGSFFVLQPGSQPVTDAFLFFVSQPGSPPVHPCSVSVDLQHFFEGLQDFSSSIVSISSFKIFNASLKFIII